MTTVNDTAAAQPAAGRAEPVGRSELVADAVARWVDELRAVGGRDPLLYFKDLKVGTLDLAAADAETRKKLLAGEPVTVSRLFPHEPLRSSALRSASAIRDKSRELAEERGIDAAMLAIGIATWANPFAAHRPTAPVLLRGATVVARDPAETDFVIEVSTEAGLNPVLLHALDTQLGLRFGLDSFRDRAGHLKYPQVVERLREFAPAHVVDGFSISHRAVLGTFAVEPNAAVADIEALAPELDDHDVVAALAGDERAAQLTRKAGGDNPPGRPVHLALNTDAAQADVVAAVATGRNVRVDAPPGTGRTQTITNLAAELVASGRRVLVVGSKRASLTNLLDRLASAGLDDVALDLTSVRTRAGAVAAVIETARRLSAESAVEPDLDGQSAGASRTGPDGDPLRRYLDALHVSRDPWDCSVYDLMAAVAAADPEVRTTARVPAEALARYGVGTREALRVKLRTYAQLGGLAAMAKTPWSGAIVPTAEAAQRIRAAVDELLSTALPDLRNAATRACVEIGLRGPESPADAIAAVDLLTAVAGTLAEFQADIWSAPLADFVAATADRRERAAHDNGLGMLARRRVRLQVRDLLADPSNRRTRAQLHEHLAAAHQQLTDWRARARDSRLPRTGPHLPAAEAAVVSAQSAFRVLADARPDLADLPELPFAEVAKRLAELAGAGDVLMALPRLAELRSDLQSAGLAGLLSELTSQNPGADHVEAAFAHCWQSSVLERVVAADPNLSGFDRAELERRLGARREADLARMESAAGPVLAHLAARFAAAADEHEGQASVVLESRTGSAPRSLRKLVAAAPDITLAARPCWVMPTLTVASLLPTQRLFDVVIIEDAGHVRPAEAVPAIARAERVVLVGDSEQLALPEFTTAVEPIAEPDDHQASYEPFTSHGGEHPPSVYEVLSGALVRLPLLTEYRIRDNGLAGFASRAAFGDRLAVITSADGSRLRHELVTADDDEGLDSSEAEVRRVVEMILEHARTRPHESLGVVTLSRPHAARVDAALRAALIRAPDVAPFLREDREEPFFVKDVDRCGDVRDAIILTIGYGRTVDGRVLYRFGALDRPGGDRRLAAAITRSRERMTVVSSFGADDLSPRRLTTDGGRALKEFLAYADRPTVLPATGHGDVLIRAVAARLRAAGASVVVGHGSGPGGIELAVRHPLRRDRFVLAVETDGPGYASAPSVQQRDRIRPDMLTRRGWKVHRVWSAAWAADPDGETARLIDAYAKAVADADAYDWAVAAAEADVVAGMPDDQPAASDDADVNEGRQPGRIKRRTKTGPDEAARAGDAEQQGEPAAGGSDEDESETHGHAGSRGGAKPLVARRCPVGEHTPRELAALARWIESRGPSRSEKDVVAELATELDLLHPGPRAHDVLIHAVRVARAGAPDLS